MKQNIWIYSIWIFTRDPIVFTKNKKWDCVLTDLSISIFSLQKMSSFRIYIYLYTDIDILRLRESCLIIGKVRETQKSSIGTTILFLDHLFTRNDF